MSLIPVGQTEQIIFLIRDQRVMIDADLARVYGVSTKRLNEQVKRNQTRFPVDFMFQLNVEEKRELVANCDRFKNLKHSTSLPFVFTEHGAIMLASVLNTEIAVQASVQVVRAFVSLREIIATHRDLARKLFELEKRYDGKFKKVFDIIYQLTGPATPHDRKIGFQRN